MIILNFGHPMTQAQIDAVKFYYGVEEDVEVKTVKVQVDMDAPLAPQIAALVDSTGLTADEFQTETFVINLPGLSTAAAVLIVELHGRMGYFPPVVRLKQEGTPPVFEVAEIINVMKVHNVARHKR